MLESERLAYLEALGITQYVAIEPIAGALALPELENSAIWPEPEALDDVEDLAQDNTEDSAEVQITAAGIEATLSKADQTDPDLSEPDRAEQTQPPELSTDTAIPQLDAGKLKLDSVGSGVSSVSPPKKVQRFALAVVTIPDRFRIFAELAVADAPGLSALEHRMLTDMLAALGYANALDQHPVKLFRWPLVNNPRIAEDPSAARDGLLAFVASAPVVNRSLFLGTKAAAVLGQAEPGNTFALAGETGADAYVTHTLLAMQRDWQLKRSAWDYILPFVNQSK